MTVLRKEILMRILLVLLLSVSFHRYAGSQPLPDEPFGGGLDENTDEDNFGANAAGDPGDPGEDPDLPIDSNILVLVAAVVGYGFIKWWNVKRKNNLQATTASYEDFIK